MTPQDLSYLRWAGTTIEQRRAHAQRMSRARNRKLTVRQRREIARIAGRASAAKRLERFAVHFNNETEQE